MATRRPARRLQQRCSPLDGAGRQRLGSIDRCPPRDEFPGVEAYDRAVFQQDCRLLLCHWRPQIGIDLRCGHNRRPGVENWTLASFDQSRQSLLQTEPECRTSIPFL